MSLKNRFELNATTIREDRESIEMVEMAPLEISRLDLNDTTREMTVMDTNQDDKFVEVHDTISEWGETAVEEYYATDDEMTFENPIEGGEWLCVDHKEITPGFFKTHNASQAEERPALHRVSPPEDKRNKSTAIIDRLQQQQAAQMAKSIRSGDQSYPSPIRGTLDHHSSELYAIQRYQRLDSLSDQARQVMGEVNRLARSPEEYRYLYTPRGKRMLDDFPKD
ncbi:hypothetical protein GGR51DRAFT_304509 [Nemania sp. FL0031]|nr:hypothetical protein GGR51DRAFT_304509 [Nemania sp. FL0031]